MQKFYLYSYEKFNQLTPGFTLLYTFITRRTIGYNKNNTSMTGWGRNPINVKIFETQPKVSVND